MIASATSPQSDWDPGAYAKFRGLRLRPALDLLAQVGPLPDGEIVDLGCGAGVVGPALKARFKAPVIGVDSSPAMLEKAAKTGAYDRVIGADARAWRPGQPPALIFSNALCHWLPDHDALFARLLAMLQPGGVLAVQMPRQYLAPSHALLRDLAQHMFADRFDFSDWTPPVAPAEHYARQLDGLGQVNAWETSFCQILAPVAQGHPVRHFTASTAMRPFLENLDARDAAAFTDAYDAALAQAYPPMADGRVMFPFQRVFFTVTRAG